MKRNKSILFLVLTARGNNYEVSNDNGRFNRLYIYKEDDLDPCFNSRSFKTIQTALNFLRKEEEEIDDITEM